MINFTPEGIFDQKDSKFVVFHSNFEPPPPTVYDKLKER